MTTHEDDEKSAEERLAEIEFRQKVLAIFEEYWESQGVQKGKVDATVRVLIWLAELSMRSRNALWTFIIFVFGAIMMAAVGALAPIQGFFQRGG